MVQGKKQLNGKPKFAEVVIGDNEAKEMRESANARNRCNPYFKFSYPNGVTSSGRTMPSRYGRTSSYVV